MVPAMNAADLTPTVLSYAKHLANINKTAQKTSDNNFWSLVTAQDDLKASREEVAHLQ